MKKRGETGKEDKKFSGGKTVLKIKLLKILMLTFVLSACVCAFDVAFADDDLYRTVKADILNMREQASTGASVVGQVPYGAQVKILWLEPEWARVTYGGTEGYVSRQYLVVPSEFVSKLPSRGAEVSSKGQAVVETAKQYLGIPYVYGGTSPSGFDCSGFVYYVYKQFGVTLNRVAADQMTNGKWVPFSEIQPGDIIGFKNSSGYVNHVGIYAGNGMMIHSPQTGETVRYESVTSGNYSLRVAAVRRIF